MSTTLCSSLQALPPGIMLADCAISGGRMDTFLKNLMEQTGGKLCIRLAPVYMDFPLPCPGGIGQELSYEQLRTCYPGGTCYFSEALCSDYFTYAKDGTAHVVLFDSLRSLREKYRHCILAGVPFVLVPDPVLRQKLR